MILLWGAWSSVYNNDSVMGCCSKWAEIMCPVYCKLLFKYRSWLYEAAGISITSFFSGVYLYGPRTSKHLCIYAVCAYTQNCLAYNLSSTISIFPTSHGLYQQQKSCTHSQNLRFWLKPNRHLAFLYHSLSLPCRLPRIPRSSPSHPPLSTSLDPAPSFPRFYRLVHPHLPLYFLPSLPPAPLTPPPSSRARRDWLLGLLHSFVPLFSFFVCFCCCCNSCCCYCYCCCC